MADLRKADNLEEQVLAAVKRRSPTAENFQIVTVQEKFLDGKLYSVAFEGPGADGKREKYLNRVYVTKDSIEPYGFDELLIQVVGARHARTPYDFLANGQVISGLIALIVTLLIVPTYLISFFVEVPIQVPDWITSGWLLILGFYFGRASSGSQ